MRTLPRAGTFLAAALAAAVAAGCSEASRLRSRCVGGDVNACVQIAEMYATGTRVPRDMTRAAEMYQHACDHGAVEVCNTLGEIYERGQQFDGGMQRAEDLFRMACGGSSQAGCTNLGLVLASRDDKKGAVALFDRACSAGLPAGCHHLAKAFERGDGVPASLARAIELHEKACGDAFADSCLALGDLFISAGRVERDAARAARYYGSALKLYDASCEAGHDRDCTERDKLRTRIAILLATQAP